ncbi:MAG: hypothetical protein AAF363_20905 [Bacteroidota bacterium]
MQKRKNIRLIIILSVLVSSSIIISFLSTDKEGSPYSGKFNIGDINSVSELEFVGDNIENKLSLKSNVWAINNRYQADNQLVEVLLNVLSRISVRRPVAKKDVEAVLDEFNKNGITLKIQSENGIQEWEITASEDGKTFFKENMGIPYEMNIPGYGSQVGSLFFLTENQWRNKVLFSSNFRTIKKLSLENFLFPDRSFEIVDSGGFLEVSGINRLDTASLIRYIENLNYFDADGYLDKGEYERFDSLETYSKPIFRLEISDIDTTFNNQILVYPRIKGDRYYFGITKDGQRFVLEENKGLSLSPDIDFFHAESE